MLSTMGFHDAPGGHGEVSFTDVRLPASAIVGGPGQAFAIAQARLGPGRVHHCMRLIGLAELALELACVRAGRARRVRQAAGQPRRQPRADRRRAHRDRPGAPARAARRVAARHRSPRTRSARSPRSRSPCRTWPSASSTWRSSCTAAPACQRRLPARRRLDDRPLAAPGRRARRGPPRRHRPPGARAPRHRPLGLFLPPPLRSYSSTER